MGRCGTPEWLVDDLMNLAEGAVAAARRAIDAAEQDASEKTDSGIARDEIATSIALMTQLKLRLEQMRFRGNA